MSKARRLHRVYEPAPGHRNSQGGTVRRDRLGRRIGRNWWREFICETLLHATLDWERKRDEYAIGYHTEEREFKQMFPMPTLKALLISNARREQAA